jgi:ribose-phosphate pyrophosphokinase
MKRLIYLHGQKEDPQVTHIQFPTGEKHIRILGLEKGDDVVLYYNDPSGDVMKLGMAVDICNEARVGSITLVMPFVPYARQDRRAVKGDPFSIGVFSRFVNSLEFDRVIITDPHSDVTPALIEFVSIIDQHQVAFQAVARLFKLVPTPLALVAPDLGAAKKTKALQNQLAHMGVTLPIIQCDKTRNPETGQITGFKILDGDPAGRHCLMVDDICDGGGTFLGLGSVLNDSDALAQSLYVTHGIFSKGTDTLFGLFDYIFTSDSFPQGDNIQVIKLETLNV